MRAAKLAVRDAIASDDAVSDLVPVEQIHSTERATLPSLPSIELVAVSSEPQESGPMVKHLISVEITVSNASEDGADAALDAIVAAVRRRLQAAETAEAPISLTGDALVVVELGATRWSISAGAQTGVIRGAAVSLSVGADE